MNQDSPLMPISYGVSEKSEDEPLLTPVSQPIVDQYLIGNHTILPNSPSLSASAEHITLPTSQGVTRTKKTRARVKSSPSMVLTSELDQKPYSKPKNTSGRLKNVPSEHMFVFKNVFNPSQTKPLKRPSTPVHPYLISMPAHDPIIRPNSVGDFSNLSYLNASVPSLLSPPMLNESFDTSETLFQPTALKLQPFTDGLNMFQNEDYLQSLEQSSFPNWSFNQ